MNCLKKNLLQTLATLDLLATFNCLYGNIYYEQLHVKTSRSALCANFSPLTPDRKKTNKARVKPIFYTNYSFSYVKQLLKTIRNYGYGVYSTSLNIFNLNANTNKNKNID